MAFYGLFPNSEQRAVSTGTVGLEDVSAWRDFFGTFSSSFAGETVNIDTAMSVGTIASGVNFIAGQMASMPLQLFKKTDDGLLKFDRSPLYKILHDVVNVDGVTSYQWRKSVFQNYLLYGRSYTFIEKSAAGVSNLWELDYEKVTPKRRDGRRIYVENRGGREIVYQANEIIDLVAMPKPNGIDHYVPIEMHRHTIGLAIAAERFASTTLNQNGVPPLQLTSTVPTSPEAAERASKGFMDVLKRVRAAKGNILPMAPGSELKPIGFDPAKLQLLELKKHLFVQIAQMLNLPPVFLQDLTGGTFSNTEQQGQMLVKHTLAPIVVHAQQELNAKLLNNTKQVIEFNMDGLLRGDFKTRMEGIVSGVRGGVLTPNEARELLNRPKMPGGDQLFMQGADRPINEDQPQKEDPAEPGADEE